MKTMQLFFHLSLYTLVGLSCFTSCTKEQTEVVIEQVCEEEDKLLSLFATFDPFNRTIFYRADYDEDLQAALNLEMLPPSTTGSTDTLYAYPAFTVAGEPLTAEVNLKEVTHEELIEISQNVNIRLEALLSEGVPPQELISQSDSRYGYYCKQVGEENTTRCHVFPNHSSNTHQKERWICWKGPGTCTDWKDVIGTSYTYYNRDCASPANESRLLWGMTCR
jgi:hypothetical protein